MGKGIKMTAVNQRKAVYRRNIRNTSYYVYGSAARVSEPAFETEPRQRKHRHRQRRPDPRYMAAPRTNCVSVNIPITVLLVATLVISVIVGYRYLCLKSSLDTHMNSIKTLETKLDALRTENDALEKSIDSSVDLNKVYEVATNELGMVRVGQDNIIQYDKTESEYVKQYEDIPTGQ